MEQVPGGSNRCPSTAAFAWFGKGVCRLLLLGLPFGTLLGPEATGSGPRFAGAGGLFVSVFLRAFKGGTVWCGRRGVTGLLFENYIVDASILIRSNF
jgi:hypothetical protein